jgi:hypothetical protein
MEAVHIFFREDEFEDAFCVDLWRERKLDEDSIDVVALVEGVNECEEVIGGGGVIGGDEFAVDAEFVAGFDFAADVDFGFRDVADEDDGESGAGKVGGDARGDGIADFGFDLAGDGDSVEDARRHGQEN